MPPSLSISAYRLCSGTLGVTCYFQSRETSFTVSHAIDDFLARQTTSMKMSVSRYLSGKTMALHLYNYIFALKMKIFYYYSLLWHSKPVRLYFLCRRYFGDQTPQAPIDFYGSCCMDISQNIFVCAL